MDHWNKKPSTKKRRETGTCTRGGRIYLHHIRVPRVVRHKCSYWYIYDKDHSVQHPMKNKRGRLLTDHKIKRTKDTSYCLGWGLRNGQQTAQKGVLQVLVVLRGTSRGEGLLPGAPEDDVEHLCRLPVDGRSGGRGCSRTWMGDVLKTKDWRRRTEGEQSEGPNLHYPSLKTLKWVFI